MYIEELRIKSSIQVFTADPANPKPEGFGSGCLVKYLDRLFFISVFHVTRGELTTFLEPNLPSSKEGTPLAPIGGLCSFDLFKLTEGIDIKEFEDLLQNPLETLDITFAEIKHPIELLQPAMDFGFFKIEEGPKVQLYLENVAEPNKETTYGFYGKVKPKYKGIYLEMTPTLKDRLKFYRTNKYFHIFLAPEIIKDKADYQGCSGAPILDDDGNLVALACQIRVGTKMIYGFSIQECIKLLKISLDTGML